MRVPDGAQRIGGSDGLGGACPRRYVLQHVDGLRPDRDTPAQSYGTAWHAVLATVHLWWLDREGDPWPVDGAARCPWCSGGGCARCGGDGLGPVWRAAAQWAAEERAAVLPDPKRAHLPGTLAVNFDGWLQVHGRRPPTGLRVAGVELDVARPICPPGGRAAYAPEVPVLVGPGVRRLARTGEAAPREGWSVVQERRQWWLGGRLDVVWEVEDDGALIVGELKAPADPQRWIVDHLTVDPQVARYTSALRWELDQGLLAPRIPPGMHVRGGLGPDRRIAGYLLDVSSSRRLRPPTVLKGRVLKDGTVRGGGLSTARAKLSSTPSWALAAELDRLGLWDGEWRLRVEQARRLVDQRWFRREEGSLPGRVLARVERELYAEARRRAAWRRAAVAAVDSDELDWAAPRVPVCTARGLSCPYRGPCFEPGARDGLLTEDGDPAADPWAVEDEDENEDAEE